MLAGAESYSKFEILARRRVRAKVTKGISLGAGDHWEEGYGKGEFLLREWEEPALSVQGRRGRFFTAWGHRRGAMWWEPLKLRLIVSHAPLSLMSRGRTMHGV